MAKDEKAKDEKGFASAPDDPVTPKAGSKAALEAEIAELKTEIAELRGKLESMKSHAVEETPEEKKARLYKQARGYINSSGKFRSGLTEDEIKEGKKFLKDLKLPLEPLVLQNELYD